MYCALNKLFLEWLGLLITYKKYLRISKPNRKRTQTQEKSNGPLGQPIQPIPGNPEITKLSLFVYYFLKTKPTAF